MKEFYRLVGIEGAPSTAYHPQTNGQTKRVNQEIEQYLCLFINYHQSDWAEWLPITEFALNDKVSSSTGYSPFFLNYSLHPRTGREVSHGSRNQRAADFTHTLKQARDAATKSLERAAEYMSRSYNHKRKPARQYKKGDMVWLEGTNLTSQQPSKKLAARRYGPFSIVKKVGKSDYHLCLPKSWRMHPVFNESLLSPYAPPQFPTQEPPLPPPPDVIDGSVEYEVEEILDSRFHWNKLQYLIKWKGYPSEENTWELEENLKRAQDAIATFHAAHPSAT